MHLLMETADVSVYTPDVEQVMVRALELEASWQGMLGEDRRAQTQGMSGLVAPGRRATLT
jgi:hypothetical protein